jgi:hypothetical protein
MIVKNICKIERPLTIPSLIPRAVLANAGPPVSFFRMATLCNEAKQVKME